MKPEFTCKLWCAVEAGPKKAHIEITVERVLKHFLFVFDIDIRRPKSSIELFWELTLRFSTPDVHGNSIICASIRPSRLTLRAGNLDLDVNGWFCQAPWFKIGENERAGKHQAVWTRERKRGVRRSHSSQCRSNWPCEVTMPRMMSMNDHA